jgi:pimeloyl-ACP methyl ester carboxylesterase
MMQSPLHEMYAPIAPRVHDWPLLISRLGELLARDDDWSAGLTAITAPVMLVFADADSIAPAHMVEFFALLGGGLRDAGWDGANRPRGQLAILAGTTHYDISARPALAEAVIPFLDAAVCQPVS